MSPSSGSLVQVWPFRVMGDMACNSRQSDSSRVEAKPTRCQLPSRRQGVAQCGVLLAVPPASQGAPAMDAILCVGPALQVGGGAACAATWARLSRPLLADASDYRMTTRLTYDMQH